MSKWEILANTTNVYKQMSKECIYYNCSNLQKNTCHKNGIFKKCLILDNANCENFKKGK